MTKQEQKEFIDYFQSINEKNEWVKDEPKSAKRRLYLYINGYKTGIAIEYFWESYGLTFLPQRDTYQYLPYDGLYEISYQGFCKEYQSISLDKSTKEEVLNKLSEWIDDIHDIISGLLNIYADRIHFFDRLSKKVHSENDITINRDENKKLIQLKIQQQTPKVIEKTEVVYTSTGSSPRRSVFDGWMGCGGHAIDDGDGDY